MRLISKPTIVARRPGVAAVELAFLLPFLLFLFVITVDFGRAFYFSMTVATCARNGALWQSDPYARAESPYKTLKDAAMADASNLNDPTNQPKIVSTTGTDSTGNEYVEVTVTYQFKSISRFPLLPSSMNITRTAKMPVAPMNPKN